MSTLISSNWVRKDGCGAVRGCWEWQYREEHGGVEVLGVGCLGVYLGLVGWGMGGMGGVGCDEIGEGGNGKGNAGRTDCALFLVIRLATWIVSVLVFDRVLSRDAVGFASAADMVDRTCGATF
jgi:hypothetical protein